MQKYEIEGVIYEANSPDEAYAMADAADKPNVTDSMNAFELGLAGIGRGMHNLYQQGGNVLGLIPDSELEESARLDKALLDTTSGAIGSFVGETVSALPVGLGAGAAVSKGLGGVMPRLAPYLGFGAEGAAEGALLAGPDNRLEGAAIGSAISGGLGGLGRVISGGATPTQSAQRLLDEGVDLTPGQMNPGGMMSAIEESAGSKFVPLIQDARNSAELGNFGAMVNQSLPPGGAPVDVSNVSTMADDLYKQFNTAYDEVKGFPVRMTGMEDQMLRRIDDAPITDDIVKSEGKWVRNALTKYDPADADTADLIGLRSKIRTRIREKYKKEDFDSVRMLEDVEDVVTERLDRSLPASIAKKLKETDSQYGKYKVIEDISYRVGDRGHPTPFLMSQAVKMAQQAKGGYARGGGGPLRELTRAGQDAFATGTPKTGMSLGIPLAAGAVGSVVGGPLAGIGGMAIPTALSAVMSGTKGGRNFYRGDTIFQKLMQDVPLTEIIRAGAVTGGVPHPLDEY